MHVPGVAGWGWRAHRERVEDRREAVDLAKLIIGLQTKMMERNRAPDQPDLHTLVLEAVEERAEQRRDGLRQHRSAARPGVRMGDLGDFSTHPGLRVKRR